MKLISYTVPPALKNVAAIAAKRWNKALGRLAWFYPVIPTLAPPNCFVVFGKVDRSDDPDRVAQCVRAASTATITLADDVKWRISTLDRVFAIGGDEDALAALMHEFGHAVGLPHAVDERDVMHGNLGSTRITSQEAENYRSFLARKADEPSSGRS